MNVLSSVSFGNSSNSEGEESFPSHIRWHQSKAKEPKQEKPYTPILIDCPVCNNQTAFIHTCCGGQRWRKCLTCKTDVYLR